MKYRLSIKAEEDIELIWLWTFQNWSKEQADRYVSQIIDEIEYLSNYPNSGKDYSHVREGYLRSKIKSHIIFYKVNHDQSFIEIIRILHERMDIEERLNE
ncbi:MAG: type II toxin-antitoxin system RelE/ParE family toxin [Romboutsia sp.]|nr:type II toxin-antitoxin system RelE/ParE family toxin [Romboutsia sp.]